MNDGKETEVSIGSTMHQEVGSVAETLEEELQRLDCCLQRNTANFTAQNVDVYSTTSRRDFFLSNANVNENIRLVVERLSLLHQLEWLQSIRRIIPQQQSSQNDTLRLYKIVRMRSYVDVALEFASGGHIEFLNLLLEEYPYTLMPRIFDLLNSTAESIDVKSIMSVLEKAISMRGYTLSSDNGPKLKRTCDWVETEEVCGFLRRLHGQVDSSVLFMTEPMSKLNYGWCCPTDADIENWLVRRALEIDRVTGLYWDASEILKIAVDMLTDKTGDSILIKQKEIAEEFCMYVSLKKEFIENDACETLLHKLPGSLMEYSSLDEFGRLSIFTEIIMVMSESVDLASMRAKYLEPLLRMRRASQAVDIGRTFQEVVMDCAVQNPAWTLDILTLEMKDQRLFRDANQLFDTCCKIVLLNRPGAKSGEMHSFHGTLLDMAFTIAESINDSNLKNKILDLQRNFRLSDLLAIIGQDLSVAYIQNMSPSDLFSMLDEFIDEKYDESINAGEWGRFQDAILSIMGESLMDADMQNKIEEKCCEYALRHGHIKLAERYLSDLRGEQKEKLVLEIAQAVLLEADEISPSSIMLAKNLLAILPGSKKAEDELKFVDTVIKLGDLGIQVSISQIRKSLNPSQILLDAIQNVHSTKGLQDVDKVVALSNNLGTGFSRQLILRKIAETALREKDAYLCEKIALELADSETLEALPIIVDIMKSGMDMRPDVRKRMLSFTLYGVNGPEIVSLLSEIQSSANNDDVLANLFSNRHFPHGCVISESDEQTLVTQIAFSLMTKPMHFLRDWTHELVSMQEDCNRLVLRSACIGGITAICLKSILSNSKSSGGDNVMGLSLGGILGMSVSNLYLLGCRSLEMLVEKDTDPELKGMIEILTNIGTRLISVADEKRVSDSMLKDAEDLWATGDFAAQRDALRQITDKIALSQVQTFGMIRHMEIFEDISTSGQPEKAAVLSDVDVLANRCGIEYGDVEEMFVAGILYRHGTKDAFQNSWSSMCLRNPERSLLLVSSFLVSLQDVNSFETLRSLQMINQCIERVGPANTLATFGPGFAGLFSRCMQFVLDNKDQNVELKPFIQPFACSLLHHVHDDLCNHHPFILVEYLSNIADVANGMLLMRFVSDIEKIYHNMLCAISNNPLSEYPVTPSFVILAALGRVISSTSPESWAHDDFNFLLAALDPDMLISLGHGALTKQLTGLGTDVPFPGSLATALVSMGELEVLKFLNVLIQKICGMPDWPGTLEDEKNLLVLRHAELSAQLHLRGLPLSTDDIKKIAQASINLIQEKNSINQVLESISYLTVSSMMYDDIMEISKVVSRISMGALSEKEILEQMYIFSINKYIRLLDYQCEDAEISMGEAIQGIYCIVRSLDQTAGRTENINLIRSTVYSSVKMYLSQSQGKSSSVQSEVQVQLIEMMMNIGKERWTDWEPPSDGNDWSLKPEGLLCSRLISHFNTYSPDFLSTVSFEPHFFSTCEDADSFFSSIAPCISNKDEAMTIWMALSKIVRPHFSISNLKKSMSSLLEVILRFEDEKATLACVDEYVAFHGEIHASLREKVVASAKGAFKDLLSLITNSSNIDESLASNVFSIILKDDEDIDELHKLAAILATVSCNLLPLLLERTDISNIQLICYKILSSKLLLEKVECSASDGPIFKCPIRLIICCRIVTQLLESGHKMAAAYVAFEALGLEKMMRVQDSCSPIISGYLNSICVIKWIGDASDLLSLGVPAVSMIQSILKDAPTDASQVLEGL